MHCIAGFSFLIGKQSLFVFAGTHTLAKTVAVLETQKLTELSLVPDHRSHLVEWLMPSPNTLSKHKCGANQFHDTTTLYLNQAVEISFVERGFHIDRRRNTENSNRTHDNDSQVDNRCQSWRYIKPGSLVLYAHLRVPSTLQSSTSHNGHTI